MADIAVRIAEQKRFLAEEAEREDEWHDSEREGRLAQIAWLFLMEGMAYFDTLRCACRVPALITHSDSNGMTLTITSEFVAPEKCGRCLLLEKINGALDHIEESNRGWCRFWGEDVPDDHYPCDTRFP